MLEIKPITDIYEASFRDLIFTYWQELMPKAEVLKTQESREAYFERDFASGEVYGAWQNDELIAYLHLLLKADIGHIEGIYVSPKVRKQGIGKQLMAWAFDKFESLGIEQIDLYVRRDNPNAKAFYEALGFGIAGYRTRMYRKDGQILEGVLSSELP